MKIGRISPTKFRLLSGALVLLAVLACLSWLMLRDCCSLSCVAQAGTVAHCAQVSPAQMVQQLPLSDSQELVIENAGVAYGQSSVKVDIRLKGSFHNESDQNLYVFIGQPTHDGAPVRYSLSSDEQYFTDLSYKVRNAIDLPHTNDVRIGVMAPRDADYSPQVYLKDPVRADLVGEASGVGMEFAEHQVRLSFPLAEYYGRKQAALPARISVTVATARDYVGFVDQISIDNIGAGETKRGDTKPTLPAQYPMLRYDSHIFKNVALAEADGSVKVEVEMQSEIEDWAQTNLSFFFVPYPASQRKAAPTDPSKSLLLPSAWSFYCAVYSPNRLFCKESRGADFTYDTGYAERSVLEQPAGIQFRALGGAKYQLELAPENAAKLRAGSDGYALLLMAGRDGFSPTSVYGWRLSRRCQLLRSLTNTISPR
jgi:hypothetical protein